MRRSLLAAIFMIIGFLEIGSPARAEDPNVTIIKKLFSKIRSVISVGDPTSPAVNEFLVLSNPGYLVDPTLDMTKLPDRRKLARVIDRNIEADFILHPKATYAANTYKYILQYHEAPTYTLNATQKAQLAAARKVLFQKGDPKKGYSDDFKTFRATRIVLSQAIENVMTFRNANPDLEVPATKLEALKEANEDWNNLGQKDDIIAAQAIHDSYAHYDPNVWWGGLQSTYDDNSDQLSPTNSIPRYNFLPEYKNWLDTTRNWTSLNTNQKDIEQTTTSSTTQVSGGFGADFGLFSIGGDYKHLENRTYFKLDVSEYTLSMEISRVDIDRPWMDALVFRSQAWQWLPTAPLGKNFLISDGANALGGVPPKGEMAFLPTGLLLARNVKLSGKFGGDLVKTFNQKTSGGGSIGWGPFSLGGRVDTEDANTYTKANVNATSLEFSSAQILGYFVTVLPKSPNRDPSLHFPSDDSKEFLKTIVEHSKAEADKLGLTATSLLNILKKP